LFIEELPRFRQYENVIFKNGGVFVLAFGDLPNHSKMNEPTAYSPGVNLTPTASLNFVAVILLPSIALKKRNGRPRSSS
jgi:hypothetical protein